MMEKLWTKVGVVLVGGFLLGSGLILAAQHVQAHTSSERLPTPSCGNLPATAFFDVTAPVTSGTALESTVTVTKQGGSVTGRGDSKYRYARITVPALAAGELRVFDGNTTGPSDAVLCRGSSQVARSITSYSAHNSAHSAATAATRAATAATTAYNKDDTIDSDDAGTADVVPDNMSFTAISQALSRVRGGLNSARSALGTAASALNTAAAANPADRTTIEPFATAARNAEQTALTAYNTTITGTIDTSTDPPTVTVTGTGTNAVYPTGATNDQKLPIARQALSNALTALGGATGTDGAIGALTTAATNLGTNTASLAHEGFQIRAAVAPGDEEYILVVAPQSAGTALTFNAQFHGAISDERRQRTLRAGVPDTIDITITAPGLLTLETTGNIDTIGMLEDATPSDIAQAESGGSGDNFKMVVPVEDVVHTVTVEGAESRTAGAYTLDMDFNVAMPSGIITTAASMDPADSPWTATNSFTVRIPDDDTTLQIQRSAAAGNVADEDYFQFRPLSSGLLTVNANDDGTSAPDANTRGTLFGAMGQGPAMDQRAGQIATDDNSGPGGTHFKFTVPVEGSKNYLVKVEGTDGAYALEFTLTSAANVDDQTGADTITLPHPSISGTITAATPTTLQTRAWYLFNIEEPGALYLHTTGPTDVVGYLSGPDGSLVGEDDNSGAGTNFRIAVNVAPGLHILEVEGQTAQTAGNYTLEASFVAGPGPEPPTEPTTPTTPEPEPEPETDATGNLGNPPHNSTRSGIGIISGWVCQAQQRHHHD